MLEVRSQAHDSGSPKAFCPVVDAGLMPVPGQVGCSGATVGLGLYIAVGISGAIPYLAGIDSSNMVIAIDEAPEAPIFDKADLGIVGGMGDRFQADRGYQAAKGRRIGRH